MEKLRLKWFDIAILSIIVLCLIALFIPFSPLENNYYSLFTYLLVAMQNGEAIRVIAFTFHIIFALMAISLLIFDKKPFFKIALFMSAICVLLLSLRDWPTRLFSTIIGSIYLFVLVFSIVIDAIMNHESLGKSQNSNE